MGDEADPTELAGVAEAETESVQAWALDDDRDDAETQRITPGRITAAAVAASLIVTAAATGIAYAYLKSRAPAPAPTSPAPTTVAQPSTPALPPPPAPPGAGPQPQLLDGTYRIFTDWDNTTVRNIERAGGGTVHWEHGGESDTMWFAFTSTCTPSDCISTGRAVTQDGSRVLAGAPTSVLRLVNGVWEEQAPVRWQAQCTYVDDGTVAGKAWHSQTWNFEPRPDGTFHGDMTTTVETNECGDVGDTAITPIVATRIGNAPPGL